LIWATNHRRAGTPGGSGQECLRYFVSISGKVMFSKKEESRFPTEREILDKVTALRG
jgi:hypothetical protein